MPPSFNSYSNSNMEEIAARVVGECRGEDDYAGFYDEFHFERDLVLQSVKIEGDDGDDEDKEIEFEFEFKCGTEDSESSPISADEIFQNGKIRAIYPIFNRDLLIGDVERESETKESKTVRLPLMKLFVEERETETTSSCASSDVDELEGIPEEMYCAWRPKSATDETERRCKKSNSTGSMYKRWKLKDLLPRSHSGGSKDRIVYLNLSSRGGSRENKEKLKEAPAGPRKMTSVVAPPASMYNRDGGEKRRTYLPYRADLVGIFSRAGFQ